MADDEKPEDENTGNEASDEQASDEQASSQQSGEGARDEATDGGSEQSEESEDSEESDAKTGKNAEDTTPKSDVDDPEFGKKDDEPVNDTQMKYLKPLAEHMGEEVPDDMSEADAADKINEMQENAAS